MTFDIWLRLLWGGKILEPTAFVKEVIEKVCLALRQGDNVVLVGYSYGGSVAARVAMYLRLFCKELNIRNLKKNLHVVTFGSIFIPPPALTAGVDVKHYAFENDIAEYCHKVKNAPYLTRLQPRKLDPLSSHMDYDEYILDIARSGRLPDGTFV